MPPTEDRALWRGFPTLCIDRSCLSRFREFHVRITVTIGSPGSCFLQEDIYSLSSQSPDLLSLSSNFEDKPFLAASMSKGVKSILKNPTPPEWKEADEIVPNLWLGT